MRLSFHIGIHKTGTTLIQTNLSENIDLLREKGVFYVNSEIPQAIIHQREALRKLQNPNRADPPKDALEQINNKILLLAERVGANTILISEENRIGYPLYSELVKVGAPARFYPRAEECLRRVLIGFEGLDTRLIIYRREFAQLLPSLYSEALRNLNITETIDEFCRKIDYDSLDYGALINRVLQGAPDAEVIVKQFAKIKNGVEPFLNDFIESAGISPGGFVFSTETVRESVDQQKAEELRALAKRRLKDGLSKDIDTEKNAILTRPLDRSKPIMLPDWAAAQLEH